VALSSIFLGCTNRVAARSRALRRRVPSVPSEETLMIRSLRHVVPVLGLAIPVLVAPVAARAQQPASTCEIDQNKPASLPKATLVLARVGSATASADKQKALREAVKTLSEEKKADNPIGRDWMLAQALIYWAAEPGMSGEVKRGDLGFTTSPEQTVDVLASIDSALTRIAAAKPGCASQVAQLRQSQAWLNQVNAGIQALNSQKFDSASYYARRAMLANPNSPYGHYILGTVAVQQKEYPAAEQHYQALFQTAGSDTSYKELVSSANSNMDFIRAEKVRAMVDAGQFEQVLAQASTLGDLVLTQAGVSAIQANKTADAAKLFEAALAQNPYQRDALNNLAATYYNMNAYDKIVPLVERLVAVDPGNPDNYMFAAFAYQGMGKAAAKTPAKAKLYTDSLLLWKGRADKLPAQVTFTQFTRAPEKTTIVGKVKGIAANAGPFTLKFEFLDAKGNVVGSQAATVPAITKDQTADFKVEIDKGGIVAFRYAPIS
jgi:tetratricopeptide (TPR) repeat protein